MASRLFTCPDAACAHLFDCSDAGYHPALQRHAQLNILRPNVFAALKVDALEGFAAVDVAQAVEIGRREGAVGDEVQ